MKKAIKQSRSMLVLGLCLSAFALSSCSYSTYQSSLPDAGTVSVNTPGGSPGGGGTEAPVDTSANKTKGFVVQLLASASADRAQEVKDQFEREGYPSFVSILSRDTQKLYRVQIGPYAKEADATLVLNNMKARYQKNMLVMQAIINENK